MDDCSDCDWFKAARTSRTPEATPFPTAFSCEDEPGAPAVRKVKARKIEGVSSRVKQVPGINILGTFNNEPLDPFAKGWT